MKAEVRRIDKFNAQKRTFLLVISNGKDVSGLHGKVKAVLKTFKAEIRRVFDSELAQTEAGVQKFDADSRSVTFLVNAKGSDLVDEKKYSSRSTSTFAMPHLINGAGLITAINKAIYDRAEDLRGQINAGLNRIDAIVKERDKLDDEVALNRAELNKLEKNPLTANEALAEIHGLCQKAKDNGKDSFILGVIRLTAGLALDNEGLNDKLAVKVGQFVGNYLYTANSRYAEWGRMDNEEQMEKVRQLIKSNEFKRHLKK